VVKLHGFELFLHQTSGLSRAESLEPLRTHKRSGFFTTSPLSDEHAKLDKTTPAVANLLA
jgi:hypothetical protein